MRLTDDFRRIGGLMLKNMSILQVNVNIVSVISQPDTRLAVLAMNWLNLDDM